MGISSIGCIGQLCFDCGDRLGCSIYQGYSRAEAEVERLKRQHNESAIDGQCALDEANSEIQRLTDEVKRLREFVSEFAEEDCHYGDNCPSNACTRHGTCSACKARRALDAGREEGGA